MTVAVAAAAVAATVGAAASNEHSRVAEELVGEQWRCEGGGRWSNTGGRLWCGVPKLLGEEECLAGWGKGGVCVGAKDSDFLMIPE